MYKGKFESSSKKVRKPKKRKVETASSAEVSSGKPRKSKVGTIVFYSILSAFILAFCIEAKS